MRRRLLLWGMLVGCSTAPEPGGTGGGAGGGSMHVPMPPYWYNCSVTVYCNGVDPRTLQDMSCANTLSEAKADVESRFTGGCSHSISCTTSHIECG
jgi:hypothetical protein